MINSFSEVLFFFWHKLKNQLQEETKNIHQGEINAKQRNNAHPGPNHSGDN